MVLMPLGVLACLDTLDCWTVYCDLLGLVNAGGIELPARFFAQWTLSTVCAVTRLGSARGELLAKLL